MATENISLKIGLDTSNFSNSIKGMQNELKALAKVDLSILSAADAKAVISRMGDLKDQVGLLRKEITAADPSAFFSTFSTLAGPAIAGISGLAVGMELFGAKTEEVDKVQRKLMAVISLLSTLQTIADANKLKGIMKQIPFQYLELKNRLTNVLLIKQEVIAETADVAIKNVQAASIIKLTVLQQIWNKAVLANPILLIVAGIMALVGAVVLLGKAFASNNERIKESEKTTDGLIIKNKELRESYNNIAKGWRDMKLEFQKATGEISQRTFDLEKIKNNSKDAIEVLKQELLVGIEGMRQSGILAGLGKEFNKSLTEQLKTGFVELDKLPAHFNNVQLKAWELIKVFNSKVTEQQIKDIELEALLVINEFNKINDEIDSLKNENVTDELQKLKIWRDKKLEEYKKEYEGSTEYKELLLELEKNYSTKRKNIIEKNNSDMLKLTSDNFKKLSDATKEAKSKLDEIDNGPNELKKLQENYTNDLNIQTEFHNKNKTSEADFLRAKEELNKAYFLNQEILILNNEKDKEEKLLAFRKDYLKKNLAEQKKAELDAVDKAGKVSGASPEEIAKAKYEIEKKYTDLIIEYKKDSAYTEGDALIKAEIDAQVAKLDRMLMNEKDYADAVEKIMKDAALKEDTIKQVKAAKEETYTQAAFAAIQILSDQQQAANDRELNRINTLYEDKKKALDDQLEYGLVSNEEYNQEIERQEAARLEAEKALKIKTAKEEKMIGLFNIAINTAVAISKATASLMLPLIPWLIAQGAIQAAIIAAKPIPQFAEGTNFAPGGEAIVGERGPERIILPRGSQVIPNNQLGNTVNYQQMIEYIDLSFQKYSLIPVVVSEYEMTLKQTKVKNAQINSQVQ